MADRPTVLALADFYLPGFRAGGPVRSIQNLVASLGGEFQFLIITRDRDLGSDRPYPGVSGSRWIPVESSVVRYLTPKETASVLRRVVRSVPHDVLYLNSFFSPRFSIAPLLLRRVNAIPRRPLVIAPRGEFSRGALGLKSSKKRAWLWMASVLGLYRDALWQASSDDEARDIGAVIGRRGTVIVAPDIAPSVDVTRGDPSDRWKAPGSARIVSLARISPMKNLEFAVALVGALSSGHVEFDIFGPVEDRGYWNRCQELIAEISGENVQIAYRGEVPHPEVHALLSTYDLMLLPTRGENFGHVIHEALAAGCPVAVSDRTPWNDIASEGAGWVLSLEDEASWIAAVERVVRSDDSTLQSLRDAARRLAESRGWRREDIAKNRELFLRSIG